MGQASDTYANLIRYQYNDWLTRFYPKQNYENLYSLRIRKVFFIGTSFNKSLSSHQ